MFCFQKIIISFFLVNSEDSLGGGISSVGVLGGAGSEVESSFGADSFGASGTRGDLPFPPWHQI